MKSFNEKISLLVVIFNKKITDSETISSLLKTDIEAIDLHIHNNGPTEIVIENEINFLFVKKKISVTLTNCLENKPLSILYNNFIEKNITADKIIILDDDSTITDSFILETNKDTYDLSLPKIFSRSDNNQYYPLRNNQLITEYGDLKFIDNTWSIGSGIIITKRILSVFNENNMKLFDENYALYGVDISFFRRLWILEHKGYIFQVSINSEINHSLSRTEIIQTLFRRKERLLDLAITARRYGTAKILFSFIKQISKSFFNNGIYVTFSVLKYFVIGTHPRVISWRENRKIK